MKDLAASTGADPAATDVARVLRLPGFRNHKYGGAGHTVTADRILDDRYHVNRFGGVSPMMSAVEASQPTPRLGVHRRSQSERDWAYVKGALRRGSAPEEVVRALREARRGEKSNPDYYARLTVAKAIGELSRG